MDEIEVVGFLEEALTERDTELQEKEMPEVNIGEALPIEENLDFAMEYDEYGTVEVMGSLRDGIIGNKTNSLVTIDSNITAKKATVGQWAKAQTWTTQEAEKVMRLGINLPSFKQDTLYANAVATIQYAGYLGHEGVKGQVGLLNSPEVQVINATPANKTLKEMTSEEVVSMILDAYGVAWSKSDYRIEPDSIAFHAQDFMEIMQKFDPNPVIIGQDLLPISAMDRILAALRKASGNGNFNLSFIKVPQNLAVDIVAGKTRFVIYSKNADYVAMNVHMPELLQVRQRDLLTFECGYRSAFTGAKWKVPQSAVYVDYKSSTTTP